MFAMDRTNELVMTGYLISGHDHKSKDDVEGSLNINLNLITFYLLLS